MANDHMAGGQQVGHDWNRRDLMAIFRAYAKVLEPDDPTMRIYEAGLRPCPGPPGLVLADVLRRTGGVYQTTTPLVQQLRDDIREVAELTSNPELLAIADLTEVPVSLEHLRGLDPQTRIIVATSLSYEADEGARVSRSRAQRPVLATIMPDGTVVAGDAFPAPPATTSLRAGLLRARGSVGVCGFNEIARARGVVSVLDALRTWARSSVTRGREYLVRGLASRIDSFLWAKITDIHR
jgi:hypothetical protein